MPEYIPDNTYDKEILYKKRGILLKFIKYSRDIPIIPTRYLKRVNRFDIFDITTMVGYSTLVHTYTFLCVSTIEYCK
jgi:hypothetical protein